MTNKIICTRGIPASGKSTWAKEQDITSISKDDIREDLHNGVYSKENEKEVIDNERSFVKQIMELWEDIIVDNTHLWLGNPHLIYYRKLAEKYWYEFEIRDFFITREKAIERDSKRDKPVGREVIDKCIKIANNGIYPSNPKFRKTNKELKDCYVVDIDWTLAFMDDKRSPYDYTKVGGDRANPFLINMLNVLKETADIIVVSGRKNECKEETKVWLQEAWLYYTKLKMRETDDTRKDSIVKKEIWDNEIKPYYNTVWVFDDRNQVCEMWRLELELPCYQVWWGNF